MRGNNLMQLSNFAASVAYRGDEGRVRFLAEQILRDCQVAFEILLE